VNILLPKHDFLLMWNVDLNTLHKQLWKTERTSPPEGGSLAVHSNYSAYLNAGISLHVMKLNSKNQ